VEGAEAAVGPDDDEVSPLTQSIGGLDVDGLEDKRATGGRASLPKRAAVFLADIDQRYLQRAIRNCLPRHSPGVASFLIDAASCMAPRHR
jgi:hypothetical protein